MKRLLCIKPAAAFCAALALCLWAGGALAQPAVEAAPLAGALYEPEGADAQTATYVFGYAYPQLAGDRPQDVAVNAYYAALAADASASAAPEILAALEAPPGPGMPAYYTRLEYTVTANTDDYLSVLLTSRQFLGNAETERWTADVFAMSGVYAGRRVSLSQAMGLEQEDGAAAQGVSYASELVYGLVWQIIGQQTALRQRDYDPSLTLADLERVLSPENDFYLDADGNFVFYVQAGELAGEVEGIVTFPFSSAELLSAVKP